MTNSISALSGFLQCAASPALPSGAACVPPAINAPPIPPTSPLPAAIQGSKMHINLNNCPSELRRFVASPYVVIHKYSKAYYLKKQYWAKVYEVQYSLLTNPLSTSLPLDDDTDRPVPETSRKSFVAATGDEIGLFGEAATAEDAARELQIRLSSSILQLLEQSQSHCLPSKRKHQDVLLKDFEEEMVSHGVRILSAPRYVPMKVTFDFAALKSKLPASTTDTQPATYAAIDGARPATACVTVTAQQEAQPAAIEQS